jgi:alpha-amylase/alpha-mannosidase (GH57 family)
VVAEHGLQWLCSDEAVLGWTKHHFFHRDEHGNIIAPEVLYQPYRLETEHGDLAIVFRDHRLSDLIGFTYSSMEPDAAAQDLIAHLDATAARLRSSQESDATTLEQPWLVTIALDGENCWEYYPQDGLLFLDNLYARLNARQDIKLVTVSEYLAQFPPRETIPVQMLHSGSWIDGNFTTWIGDPIKNKAWNLLKAARDTLANHPEATEKTNPGAWDALFAAEGSDWFWWFGEGHSSNQDAMFDQLFREHLIALYQALGEPVPDSLNHPLEQHTPTADYPPQGFIHPIIDGLGNEQDWNHAGRISVGGARGTMHRASSVQRLWYGVDHLNFYLRFDLQANQTLGQREFQELHLLWFYPHQRMHNSPIPLENLPNQAPLNYLYHHHLCLNLATGKTVLEEAISHAQWQPQAHTATYALESCLEVAVPWCDLPLVHPDWHLNLVAVLAHQGCYVDYLPENHLIPLTVP